LQAKSFS